MKSELVHCLAEDENVHGIPTISTVKQFSTKYPAFPEGGIRHLIFNEETNGFQEAFLRVGKKRLINETAFFKILMEQNGGLK